MASYLAYHFTVSPVQPGSEIMTALLADMGFESFEQVERGFTAYYRQEGDEAPDLSGLSFPDFSFDYRVETIPHRNWNAEWESNFAPVDLGDRLCIRAPFHPRSKAKMEIVIMPKMSFGTGHHQTTRLVCAAMLDHDFHGSRVLDMGCGTGILSILAEMLGAKEVAGFDIDDWCVENANDNCALNGCTRVVVKKGSIEEAQSAGAFDRILANINRNILTRHMRAYGKMLNSGGLLFLSGFYLTDVEELGEVIRNAGMTITSVSNEDEWAMIVAARA